MIEVRYVEMKSIFLLCIMTVEKLLYYQFLRKRMMQKSRILPVIGIGIICMIQSLIAVFGFGAEEQIFAKIILNFVYMLLFFEAPVSQKVISALVEPIVSIASNGLAYGVFYLSVKEKPGMILVESDAAGCIISAIYLINAGIIYFILRRLKNRSGFLPVYLTHAMITIVLIGIFILSQLFEVVLEVPIKTGELLLEMICLGIFLMIVLTFYLFEKIGKVAQEKAELEIANRQYKMEIRHIESVSDSIRALRTWKHDYKQHLSVIRQLLQEENYEALRAYCEQIDHTGQGMDELVATGNAVIDALVSDKIMRARSQHIDIRYEIILSAALRIPDMDLCIILGNLLDNAIEACAKIKEEEKRQIQITMKPKRDMYYICIANSSDGIYHFSGKQELLSTKTGEDHGIGLKRMEQVVESYHGFYSYEAKEDTFAVTVILP